MDCREIRNQASAYYHREMEELFQSAISEHLILCPSCQREYQEFRSLLNKIGSAGHQEVPLAPDYFDRLVEKIKCDPEISPALVKNLSSGRFLTRRTPAILLALAALLLGAIFLNPFGRPDPNYTSPLAPPPLSSQVSPSISQREYMRHLALVDPEDPRGNVQLARWCKEKKLFSEAREHLQRALNLEPKNSEARALEKEFKM